jgi:Transposase, Mutator family
MPAVLLLERCRGQRNSARPRRSGPAAAGVGRDPRVFTAGSAVEARQRLGQVVDQLRPHAPKVARLLEDAEADLLAFYGFPAEHWSKLRSTNPLERVNREIGRRSDVVGSSPTTPPCCGWPGCCWWNRTMRCFYVLSSWRSGRWGQLALHEAEQLAG